MKILDRTGSKIGNWDVLKKINITGKSEYLCKCSCGKEKIFSSAHIYKISKCKDCESKEKILKHVGKKHGKLTCIGITDDKPHRKLIILCECGVKYTMKGVSQLNRSYSCKSCAGGYYPGLEINGIIILERVDNRIWRMKCHCGKIYEKIPNHDRGKFYDCGCVTKKKWSTEAEKKIGMKCGFLTVKKVLPSENGHLQLLVKCKCGTKLKINNGHEFKSYSCGCYKPISLPKGEKANSATLKNCEVISMRQFYEKGIYSEKELSEMFNKKPEYIRRILKKQIWKYV